MIYIDPPPEQPELPPFGEQKSCGKEDCKPEEHSTGYGFAGGKGLGVYSYCEGCKKVTSKSYDPEEDEDESHGS